MQRLFLIPVFLLSTFSFAQNISLDYSNRISSDSIRQYLFILAADSMEGRETGKPGQKKAANYLKSKYTQWQLQPKGDSVTFGRDEPTRNYFQNHSISLKSNKGNNLIVNGKEFLFGKDFFYSESKGDTLLKYKDFLFVGNDNKKNPWPILLSSRKYINKNLILFDVDSTEFPGRLSFIFQKPNFPSSVFIITTKPKVRAQLSDGVYFCGDTYKVPMFLITNDVADTIFTTKQLNYIKFWLKGGFGPNTKGKPYSWKTKPAVSVNRLNNTGELMGQNVIAMIPGTELPNETVVISSHYDHLGIRDSAIYPGADDNASGTSAVLELARIFSIANSEGHGPRRNILFMNVSGEEKGLLGSAWFVANPTIPLNEIVADLNIDMIGRTDSIHDSSGESHYIYIIGSDKLSTDLHRINEDQNSIGPKLLLNYKYNSPDDPNHFYTRSDHYNFAKNGIPVIFYFDGKHADYHKPTDVPEKINVSQLSERARLVFLTAWELANRNERIRIDEKNDPTK